MSKKIIIYRRTIAATFILTSFIVPFVATSAYWLGILTVANIFAVFAASWDILSGFTGKENFGYAFFAGMGAYFVGIVSEFFFAIPWWLSVPLSGVLAMIAGIIIGLPTLKVKGPYFALFTLALAAIAQHFVSAFGKVTGGENGLYGITLLNSNAIVSYYIALIFALVSVSALFMFGVSRYGLILKALKTDEDAAEAVGINPAKYKIIAFAISSLFAGMSGSMLAHYYGYVGPDIVFPLSLNVIIMAVLGGIGMIIPAALGGYTLEILLQYMNVYFEGYSSLVYTGILLAAILFLPNGIYKSIYEFLSNGGRHSVDEHS